MKTLYEDDALSLREANLTVPGAAHAVPKIESLNWQGIATELNDSGNTLLKGILRPETPSVVLWRSEGIIG